MPLPLAIPIVIGVEELIAAAVAAWRVYRLARTVQAVAQAAEAAEAAQKEADARAAEKARTDAQAKADAASGCSGGNCDPDPNCEKWRHDTKKALYDVKTPKGIGGAGGGNKGLAQMMCEWMNGTLPNGSDHAKSVEETVRRIEKNLKNLKNKRQFRGPDSADLEKEAEPILELADKKDALPHTPRADFQQHCVDKALALARKHLGG